MRQYLVPRYIGFRPQVYPEHFLMPTTQPEQRELYALSDALRHSVDFFLDLYRLLGEFSLILHPRLG